ncbi:MAG: hypothetical protein IKV59_05945 [Lachnospiraceae bacterium]|nr:hypothetical protein [Lachnospiraceae bacterium]
MAKETKQQIIERLEKQVQLYLQACNEQVKEINELMEQKDTDFQNSSLYIQMKRDIDTLNMRIQSLERENKKLKNPPKIRNERNAGRKPKMRDEQKYQIKQMYKSGMSMKQISETLECSVGLIHKIIHELNSEYES